MVDHLRSGADGVARVLEGPGRSAEGLDHARSGDLIAFSAEDAWFTYYYWDDDAKAPDFARCVDIHRKYGYDPVELFLDPAIAFPRLRIASTVRSAGSFRISDGSIARAGPASRASSASASSRRLTACRPSGRAGWSP